MMKTVIYIITAAVGLVSTVSAQVVLEAPVANLTERWSTNSAGWDSSDPLCGWTNAALVFKCNVRGDIDYGTYTSVLAGSSNASSGYFSGNFGKIESASFEAISSGFAMQPNFYFKSRNGVIWRTRFDSALAGKPDGVVVNVDIPFSYSTNWWSAWPTNRAAHYAADVEDVVELGFEFVRLAKDKTAQQLMVDNLRLNGPWGGPFVKGVPAAWVLECGLPATNMEEIATADSDGDGFVNLAEFLAGTVPTNSSSFFKVDIARNEAGEMMLKWNGNNKYVSYSILESSNLLNESGFVMKTTNITELSAKVSANPDQGEVGPKFYKVMINSSTNW